MPKEGEHIIKFGCHDDNTGRFAEHVREYKTWEVSDSALTDNPHGTERCLKDHLRNKNALLSARHVNKLTRDTELFAGTLAIYKGYVNKTIELAQRQDHGVNMEYERELTKRMEEETKRMGEETRRMEEETKRAQVNLEIRKAELQAETRKLELQVEMMRLGRQADHDREPSTPTMPACSHITSQTEEAEYATAFVSAQCEKTGCRSHQILYADLVRRCAQWIANHEMYHGLACEALHVRKAMERFTGRKYSTQRPTSDKKMNGLSGWNGVRYRRS